MLPGNGTRTVTGRGEMVSLKDASLIRTSGPGQGIWFGASGVAVVGSAVSIG